MALSTRSERKQKRAARRNGRERWYHGTLDFLADVFLFVPELLIGLLRGIGYIFRGLFHVLEAIGDIFT